MTAKGSTYFSVRTTKDNVVRHIRSFRVQNYLGANHRITKAIELFF